MGWLEAAREQMSPPHARNDFSPELLDALSQAFNEVWAVIRAHHPLRDDSKDAERQSALSRTLIELASNGIADPAELRKRTLETLPLDGDVSPVVGDEV